MRVRFLFLLMFPLAAQATSPDTLVDLLATPGAIQRIVRAPYKDANYAYDLVPLYLYEGKQVFIHASRIGVKLAEKERYGFELFLDYRFEGFPADKTPASLAGMAERNPSVDFGMAYRRRSLLGNIDLEVMHDANDASHGTELRAGYSLDIDAGRWHFRPSVVAARRNANLNNYYYGVRTGEATASRPAYLPGAGTDLSFDLYAIYDLSERWRALGGIGIKHLDADVRRSPIVENKEQASALVGLAYDFGSHAAYSEQSQPLHLKLLAGRATECNFLPVVTFRCASTRSEDDTRIFGIELGRVLIDGVNGWPLDFVSYVGVLRHDERGIVPGGWQVHGSIKAYYTGLPTQVRTRFGMAAGFALASRVPLTEQRDQARRGRATSKLLNYLDPTLDISLGDLFGVKRHHETYLGVGVSHRSGIFGTSQLLGNINGGSNYLYTYIESKL